MGREGDAGVARRAMAERARATLAAEAAVLAAEIVRVGARIAALGMVAGADGNISARLPGDRVLVTPAGVPKGDLSPGELVVVDREGAVVDGDTLPSTELPLHLAIYRTRPDVGAIVHAHPAAATGFAVAGEDFMAPVLPEIILGLGGVPLVPFALPGSPALAESAAALSAGHDALLLANHGAVAFGATLEQALWRMESLEHAARIILNARLLGRVNQLDQDQARTLSSLREQALGGDAATTVHATFVQEEAR